MAPHVDRGVMRPCHRLRVCKPRAQESPATRMCIPGAVLNAEPRRGVSWVTVPERGVQELSEALRGHHGPARFCGSLTCG